MTPIQLFTPLLILAVLAVNGCRRTLSPALIPGLFGLLATIPGDYFLAVRHASPGTPEFLYGVLAFSACQACWLWHFIRLRRRVDMPLLAGLLICLLPYLNTRVTTGQPWSLVLALNLYTALSVLNLSLALGLSGWDFAIGLLLASDICISAGLAGEPRLGRLITPLYVLALLAAAIALCLPIPAKRTAAPPPSRRAVAVCLAITLVGMAAFIAAMFFSPDGTYNPLFQMLSYLGRTEISGTPYPPCHYLFIAGMACSATAIWLFQRVQSVSLPTRWQRMMMRIGGALNAGGLLLIAAIPENVHMRLHCQACVIATLGGGLFMLAFRPKGREWLATALPFLIAVAFDIAQRLDRRDIIPFAPAVPTLQKLVILSYWLWMMHRLLHLLAHFPQPEGTGHAPGTEATGA